MRELCVCKADRRSDLDDVTWPRTLPGCLYQDYVHTFSAQRLRPTPRASI